VSAHEVNAVGRYLTGLVEEGGLPEKLLVVHPFTRPMIRDDQRLRTRDGVALVVGVDAIGAPRAKAATYGRRGCPPSRTGSCSSRGASARGFRPPRCSACAPRRTS
jgi:hypothetical protein